VQTVCNERQRGQLHSPAQRGRVQWRISQRHHRRVCRADGDRVCVWRPGRAPWLTWREIDGLRIAGLGGIFRGQVWAPPGQWLHERPEDFAARCGKGNLWRGGLPRKHRSSIFPSDYFGLVGQRADILVTHEAPSSHPHGFDAIDELARSLGVGKAFHGHHHDRLDYSGHRERLEFDAFGVGFCGVSDANGRMVRPGDFDEARAHRQTS
jgi:hypothetical protein